MKLLVTLPTRVAHDPLLNEGVSYLERLRPPFSASAVFVHKKMPEAKRKDLEAEELLKRTEGYYRIALTENGRHFTSATFARHMERLMEKSSKIAFIVGGAYGLSPELIQKSNEVLSLSPMTMPHRMAFLVLAEQIYRAAEIIGGTPYHK